jgi:L-rhamnose mutarotase
MARVAFHLRIRDGKRTEYREKHRDVPERLEDAYLDSGAGLEAYSVFEKDGHVFGFMELDDPEVIEAVMEDSDAQADWNDEMAGILEDDDDIWMEEVYRMV